MFPNGDPPAGITFLDEEALRNFRRQDLQGKFRVIEQWVRDDGIEVLMIDTANDFFRGDENPSAETAVGGFFDQLRNLALPACILVRHDRKRRAEDEESGNSNERIRGSAEFKEDPEVILYLKRTDRRTNEVRFEVGKLRYGSRPEPLTLWFDAGCFRLTPLPPVIAVLESGSKSRQEIITDSHSRFDLEERKVDQMLDQQNHFLQREQVGHERRYQIDPDHCADAPWYPFLNGFGR